MYLCDYDFPESYDSSSKSDVLAFLISSKKSRYIIVEKVFSQLFPELYLELLLINFPSNFSFSQKVYHFLHNDNNLQLCKCPICGNIITNFMGFKTGYNKTCSKQCALTLMKQTYTHTCIEKYGVSNFSKTKEYKIKFENTCVKKYGCKNPFQNNDIKFKISQTNKDKYGVENPSQNIEIKEKKKSTCLSNLGVEYPGQSKEVKEKIKQTCIERYGVENYAQTDECQEKMRQTCIEKYGVDNYSQTDECQEKMRQTCIEKYGVENYSQTTECQEKMRQTCIEKYGVDNYSKTNEFSKKRKKKINYNNCSFDSNWEIIVYKYCVLMKFDFEYQPNILFNYEYNGKKHKYQPDFLINNKIYEVKGNHFFEGDKMICPYDRNKDDLFEAKHQCMKNNNVIILTEKHIIEIEKKIKELN